ncbi:hypothetical protein ABPG75_009841 [Micractinium tetrahymenae]
MHASPTAPRLHSIHCTPCRLPCSLLKKGTKHSRRTRAVYFSVAAGHPAALLTFQNLSVKMPLPAVALAAAAAQGRLLGRLLCLGGPSKAASMLHAPPRLGPRCSGSAAGFGSSGGSVATTAAAAPERAPTEGALEEQGLVVASELDLENESAVLSGLPRRLGAEAADASRTGAFQRLPMVAPSKELLESALRRAARVPYNKKLKNEAQKAKNRAARALDTLMKELCVPLAAYIKGFPAPSRLHPFERALLELTVGPGTYERVLARVEALRRSTVEVGKAYATRASRAANKKEALALQEEGFARLEAVFSRGSYAVDELKDVAKSLRRLPVVEPELPTVALVGAPNVGKSSLVQLLSSGLPEVQNYPFTTRSIKMGHFYVAGRRHQVTDTPGLLNRPEEDRNAMERLTLACLQHLPTAVLFVADLTGECGTTVANQWAIREELKQRFLSKPWVDVLSKADLLEEEFDEADRLLASNDPIQQQRAQPPAEQGAAPISHVAGRLADATGCDTIAAHQSQRQVSSAVQFAAVLPHALRVSSTSGAGVEQLKLAMLAMLEQHDLQQQQQHPEPEP